MVTKKEKKATKRKPKEKMEEVTLMHIEEPSLDAEVFAQTNEFLLLRVGNHLCSVERSIRDGETHLKDLLEA